MHCDGVTASVKAYTAWVDGSILILWSFLLTVNCVNQDGDATCNRQQASKDTLCSTYKSWAENNCAKLCGVKCGKIIMHYTYV